MTMTMHTLLENYKAKYAEAVRQKSPDALHYADIISEAKRIIREFELAGQMYSKAYNTERESA